jgi:hypothetical protein
MGIARRSPIKQGQHNMEYTESSLSHGIHGKKVQYYSASRKAR